jgi:hypothetical protein
MDKINAVRTVDGRAAVFLRFGQAGYVVVAAVDGERTIERSIWMELPLWTPPTPKDICTIYEPSSNENAD